MTRLTSGHEMLNIAGELAKQGKCPKEIADHLAEHTGLLRTYVVDFLRRNQGSWMTP